MLCLMADANALPVDSDTHDKLLYTTHCVSCHITQQNWKDEKVANNWINLRKEVLRWQQSLQLEPDKEDDSKIVSNYLNNYIFYCQ